MHKKTFYLGRDDSIVTNWRTFGEINNQIMMGKNNLGFTLLVLRLIFRATYSIFLQSTHIDDIITSFY